MIEVIGTSILGPMRKEMTLLTTNEIEGIMPKLGPLHWQFLGSVTRSDTFPVTEKAHNRAPSTQLGNPRPTFLPTQVGLGITQAVHCEVIHVSFCTVQCVISTSILVNLANPGISPPYYKKSFN